MALHIMDVDVEVFVAVFVGDLLDIEHRLEFLETVADDIFLPHIVVDAALSVLIGSDAIVARRGLVYIDGGVVEEEELALRREVGKVKCNLAETLQGCS